MKLSSSPGQQAKEREEARSQATTAIPQHAWQRTLATEFPPLKSFSVSWKDGLKLASLGLRMWSYTRREKAQGRLPVIDPFVNNPTEPIMGVPCGGIGSGSIGRGWRGDFVRWQLQPAGVARTGIVEADQFSVYMRELPPAPAAASVTAAGTQTAPQQLPGGPLRPSMATVLHPGKPKGGKLEWDWKVTGQKCTYFALFPRAWTLYQEPNPNVPLVCRQISPVIPHNYRETSFPMCVFEWEVRNTYKDRDVEVSIMFTFQNGTGGPTDSQGGHVHHAFARNSGGACTIDESAVKGEKPTHPCCSRREGCSASKASASSSYPSFSSASSSSGSSHARCHCQVHADVVGVCMHHAPQAGDPLSFAVATRSPPAAPLSTDTSMESGKETSVNADVSYCTHFRTSDRQSCNRLWQDFATDGRLEDVQVTTPSLPGETVGCAVACKVRVPANSTRTVTFSLAWDSPVARFRSGAAYTRRYTRFWGSEGSAAPDMAAYALAHYQEWEPAIYEWQRPVLEDPRLPTYYKHALFNELYYLVDGGTVWTHASRTSLDTVLAEHAQRDRESARTGAHAHKHEAKDIEHQFHHHHAHAHTHEQGSTTTSARPANPGKQEEAADSKPTEELRKEPSLSAPPSAERDDTLLLDVISGTHAFPTDKSGVNDAGEGTMEDVGHFAYLESLEYLMYNTYDVHFYASFALSMLWPKLELSLQRDVAAATLLEYEHIWPVMHSGLLAMRKVSGAVPHDMGNPGEDPWNKVNSYNIQDISRWKDLPCKFVLQVYRDYVATNDKAFLAEVWPVVRKTLSYAAQFDLDDDGVIDNEGFPDQTYDTWSAVGCSAYTGGLWLASLAAAREMARVMAEDALVAEYTATLKRGQESYNSKLWNGLYYNYDSSESTHHDSIMSDQLAGQWYAKACGLESIVPEEHAYIALHTVYENNVKRFQQGRMGAVNGMRLNGRVDDSCMQSSEVWTGTTFALAAGMLQQGLVQEAFTTARGIIDTSYERVGYMFQTPEAWDQRGAYRAFAYMRPLSIWAMQWAWERLYATDTQHVLAQNTLGGETKEQRTESQSTPVSDARAVTPVDTHPPFARTASEPAALSVSAAAVPLLPSYSSSALPSLSASESSSFHLSSELLASLHPSEAASLRERVSQLPPSLRPVVAHGEMQRRASTPDLLSLLPRTPVNPEMRKHISKRVKEREAADQLRFKALLASQQRTPSQSHSSTPASTRM